MARRRLYNSLAGHSHGVADVVSGEDEDGATLHQPAQADPERDHPVNADQLHHDPVDLVEQADCARIHQGATWPTGRVGETSKVPQGLPVRAHCIASPSRDGGLGLGNGGAGRCLIKDVEEQPSSQCSQHERCGRPMHIERQRDYGLRAIALPLSSPGLHQDGSRMHQHRLDHDVACNLL